MLNFKLYRSRALIYCLITAFSFLAWPRDSFAQKNEGSMTGFVFGEDMKTPVENAVVKLRNIADGREYQSRPTDKSGLYGLKNLPAGRYILGVSDLQGDYNFQYDLQIKPDEVAKLAVSLKPVDQASGQSPQDRNKNRRAFFLTPLGIAVIVGSAGFLIYGGIKLFDEEVKSPARR